MASHNLLLLPSSNLADAASQNDDNEMAIKLTMQRVLDGVRRG